MMKNFVLLVFVVLHMELFATITYVDESQYADSIVGEKNLKGAKFLGGTIWQDQPINDKIDAFTYKEAYEYCKNLNLLGIKKWRLPIKTDFMILDTQMKKLRYVAKRNHLFSWYFTQTPTKSDDKVYAADISTNSYPYITTTKKRYKNCVRCVLNPNIYNQYQTQKAKKIVEKNTLDAYLDAFLKSGDKKYLKKALNVAKTTKDNAKIEATLYKYLGFFKVFEMLQDGEVINKKSNDYDNNNRLMAMMQKNKKLRYRFSVRPRKKSALKLKYNTYKVTINFKLVLNYRVVTLGIGTSKEEIVYVEKTFVLSKKNNYKKTIEVDFGNIEQGTKARALIVNYSSRLTDATLSYELKDTKIELAQ